MTADAQTATVLHACETMFRPLYRFCNPMLLGLDNVRADRPALYLGNHTNFEILDIAYLLMAAHDHDGVALKPLLTNLARKDDEWARVLPKLGVHDSGREHCLAMMRHSESILFFVGGTRDLAYLRQRHRFLTWQERLGCVKLAISHGYSIVPFAMLAADRRYDLEHDQREIARTPLAPMLERLSIDAPHIDKNSLLIPRPERIYIKFMPTVNTFTQVSNGTDDFAVQSLRDQIKSSIDQGLNELLTIRSTDPGRNLTAPPAARLAKSS